MPVKPNEQLDELRGYLRRMSAEMDAMLLKSFHLGRAQGLEEGHEIARTALNEVMQSVLSRDAGSASPHIDVAPRGLPPHAGETKQAVLDALTASARGMKPKEIFDHIEKVGLITIKPGTVRTTLHRLRDDGMVEQRNGLWFRTKEGPAEAEPSEERGGGMVQGYGYPPEHPEGSSPSTSTTTPDDDQSSGSDDQEAINDMLS